MRDARGVAMMLGVLKSQALLVDDHPLFRSGLATALRAEPDIEVVGEASTAAEAVSIMRSTKGFCQGERGAVTTSAMPMPRTRRRNSPP